jgi:hypothetical protein
MFNPAIYPHTPVDPKVFIQKVTNTLQSHSVFVSADTPKVLKELCGLLNLSITNPKTNTLTNKRFWAFPAQTGVGKSVSLQTYVSLLNNESTLIVVSKKEEAEKYCDHINQLRGNPSYAKCFYYEPNPSGAHPNLVNNVKSLKQVQCLVVTHERFRKINNTGDVENFSYYLPATVGKETKRDLVVIDEKLSFYNKTTFTVEALEELVSFVKNGFAYSPAVQSVCTPAHILNVLQELLNLLNEYLIKPQKVHSIAEYELFERLEAKGLKQLDFDILLSVVEERLNEISTELKGVSSSNDSPFTSNLIEKSLKQVEQLQHILIQNDPASDDNYRSFVLFKDQKKHLVSVNNIYSRLGSCVVLDATAQFNEFYNFANKSGFSSIAMVPAPQIRKYQNLTIHKAKGFSQSRSALYKGENVDQKQTAKQYLSYAKNELQTDDQMLIVCHKEFKTTLEAQNKDQRICFTHWGNHVGRNEWSHCNKVMLIGWNYLPVIETLSTIYASGMGSADLHITQALRNKPGLLQQFKVSQIVDDLVQATMRSKTRVIATMDSDCHPTSMYLFYPDNKESKAVVDLFEKQFPQAIVKQWTPIGKQPKKKKTKSQKNADALLKVIDQKAKTHSTYLWSKVLQDSGINKTTANRAKASLYFNEQLAQRNYTMSQANGKSLQVEF